MKALEHNLPPWGVVDGLFILRHFCTLLCLVLLIQPIFNIIIEIIATKIFYSSRVCIYFHDRLIFITVFRIIVLYKGWPNSLQLEIC